jgi:hypothetical protein
MSCCVRNDIKHDAILMSYDHTINKQRQMVKVKVAVRQADDKSQVGTKKPIPSGCGGRNGVKTI